MGSSKKGSNGILWAVIVGMLLSAHGMHAQTNEPRMAVSARLSGPIELDGSLEDAAWQSLPVQGDFEQYSPVPGGAPSQRTEVRFGYDDNALYIGARMWDAAPDSIRTS